MTERAPRPSKPEIDYRALARSAALHFKREEVASIAPAWVPAGRDGFQVLVVGWCDALDVPVIAGDRRVGAYVSFMVESRPGKWAWQFDIERADAA